eukprot:COSAG01_NODE_21330_length_907_cov_0.883663_1_plen_43_part_10
MVLYIYIIYIQALIAARKTFTELVARSAWDRDNTGFVGFCTSI